MKQKFWSMTLCLFIMAGLLFTLPQSASAETEGIYEYSVSEGKATIIGCDMSVSGEITVPDTLGGYPVTVIGENAFACHDSLTSVTIPDSVTTIDDMAFYICDSLTSVAIPDSVTSIDENTFAYCTSLTSVTIPDSVTSIGEGAFYSCESLTSISIPDSVTTIGIRAFYGCESLTSVAIGNGVSTIGTSAFNSCTKLTSITIPSNVIVIENLAFYNCTSLINIEVDAQNNCYSSLNGNLYNKDKTTLIQYAIGKTDTSFAIPDGVTTIGEDAFSGCTVLTSISIPDSVTTIGMNAFSHCAGLVSVTIPNSVTSIDKYVFSVCDSLVSVTIPDSVTSIGDSAFIGCNSLTSITIPDSVTSIGDSAFIGCNSLTSITIPSSVTSIGLYAFHDCESLTNIEVDVQNSHYSSLNGNLFDKNKTMLIQYAFGKTDTSYTIPNSVTIIGEDAFSDRTVLTSVSIPDSVTTIGVRAFYECTGLLSITIPSSVTYIDDLAFYGCTNLSNIEVDAQNNHYSSLNGNLYNKDKTMLIQYATGKTDASCIIPDGVTSIYNSAFDGCSNLTSVTIPDSVTSIGLFAFYDCESLTDVYYTGTEEEWNLISIDLFNSALRIATTIHFNSSFAQHPQLRVMLNNQEISFDVPPQIVDGRTVVPLRAIFEALGATVTWDASTRTVLAEKNGTVVQLTIDEKTMYVNGKAVELDVAAMIVDGRTLVPVRAISESIDCSVAWDGNTRTVFITE